MAAESLLDTSSPFGSRSASFFEKLVWKATDWRWLPRGWRQKLRKRFARPVTGPFDFAHDGMKFRLYPAENYCDRVLFGRDELPERVEHEALLPLIEPGMVFVDIGANIGSYSIFVGSRSPEATLLAFEPHPRTHQKLRFNLQINGLPVDNVINAGVGPEPTTMTLWSDGGSNIGHTSLLKEGTAKAKVGLEVPIVPLLDTLDDRKIEHIDLLKIDIEGFEDQALASFLESAPEAQLPNHVLIEVAHRHLWKIDVEAMLAGLGYRERFATAENQLLSR
ncbi:MAG: FkbM family methyltransferase [Rhizobiaceae bacterium]